jgi:hypothetical protein
MEEKSNLMKYKNSQGGNGEETGEKFGCDFARRPDMI